MDAINGSDFLKVAYPIAAGVAAAATPGIGRGVGVMNDILSVQQQRAQAMAEQNRKLGLQQQAADAFAKAANSLGGGGEPVAPVPQIAAAAAPQNPPAVPRTLGSLFAQGDVAGPPIEATAPPPVPTMRRPYDERAKARTSKIMGPLAQYLVSQGHPVEAAKLLQDAAKESALPTLADAQGLGAPAGVPVGGRVKFPLAGGGEYEYQHPALNFEIKEVDRGNGNELVSIVRDPAVGSGRPQVAQLGKAPFNPAEIEVSGVTHPDGTRELFGVSKRGGGKLWTVNLGKTRDDQQVSKSLFEADLERLAAAVEPQTPAVKEMVARNGWDAARKIAVSALNILHQPTVMGYVTAGEPGQVVGAVPPGAKPPSTSPTPMPTAVKKLKAGR